MANSDKSWSRKPLLSVDDAAVLLGQSRSSIYRAIGRGDLPVPVFTINGRIRIARHVVERLPAGELPLTAREEEVVEAGEQSGGSSGSPGRSPSPVIMEMAGQSHPAWSQAPVSRAGVRCAPQRAGLPPEPRRCSGAPCAPSTSPGVPVSGPH